MKFSQSTLLFLTLAAAARAADPASSTPTVSTDSIQRLDPLEVTARHPGALTSPPPDLARLELRLVPGAIETIDATRFLRGRASTVEDTFTLSAGVVAQSRFGSDEARLSIRGSGLQRTFHGRGLRILQDGVPLNLADGSFDFQALEPLSARYLNVWRGGNALSYGSSTLGGAIDYVSRTGRDHAAGFVRGEAGSFGYRRASVAAGGVRGRADAYAAFTQHAQDSFRHHARQDNQRLFANIGWRFARHAETRLYLTGVRTDSELPGSLTRAQLQADPRQAAPANIALDQKRDFELFRAASKTIVHTGATAWDVTAAWTHKDLDHPIFQVVDQHTHDLLLGATVTHPSDLAGQRARLRAGVWFSRGEIRSANFVNAAGRRGALLSRAVQTATNLEAFAEHQLVLSRGFTLVLGANAAANRREHHRIVAGPASYTLEYRGLSPKIGLRWDRAEVQVYANVSDSYEPPSFSETLTNNTARHAQTARTVELGSRGQHEILRWDVSVYRAALRQELLALIDPATQLSTTLNANRTTHAGAEVSVELDLLGTHWEAAAAQRLVFRGAWTYGCFRFDDDSRYGRNVLAGLPPHLVRGELTWESDAGWYVGPTFEWVPQKTYIDHRNTLAAAPYAIAGCRVGHRTAHGFSWFAEVRNAFNRTYTATTGVIENAAGNDQPQFLPGDGRGVYAGASYQF